jgi:hypothetical protein
LWIRGARSGGGFPAAAFGYGVPDEVDPDRALALAVEPPA